MVFQTYAQALSPPGAIAGFSLTHFQFSNRGKPVVFHDDHLDYVLGLDRFFVRKASGAAKALRAACLARAAEPAAAAPGFAEVARKRTDYLPRASPRPAAMSRAGRSSATSTSTWPTACSPPRRPTPTSR